jgi:hypothetical protein
VTAGGYDGGAYRHTAAINFLVDAGTVTNGVSLPAYIQFQTTPDGSITRAERWRMSGSGHFLAGTDNAYDIGAATATRPRNVYVAGAIQVGGTTGSSPQFSINKTAGYTEKMTYMLMSYNDPSVVNYIPWEMYCQYNVTDVVNPLTQAYGGVTSTLYYGSQGGSPVSAVGTTCSLTSQIIVRNSSDHEDEHAPWLSVLRYDSNNNAFGNTTPGRAWMTDWSVHGAIAQQQGALSGVHMYMANHYNGPPRDMLGGAFWAVTAVGSGGGTEYYHQNATTYQMGVGYGVVGFGSGGTTRGWETGVQIGGSGSNWNVLASHLGTGLDISDYDSYGIRLARRYSGITKVTITNAGTGYTSLPGVTFSAAPSGGVTATGVVRLTPTTVASITVGTGGTGYTTATVTLSAPYPSGVQATATATITAGAITGFTITNAGSGYTNVPTVTITGDGAGATGTAVLTGTSIASFVITNPGYGYVTAPTISFSGGGGASAAATATIPASGIIGDVRMVITGSGYTATEPPTVTFTGGAGSGAAGTAVINFAGQVVGVMMTDLGSGYTSAPTVAIAAPSIVTATGTATRSGTTVSGVTLTNAGKGYGASAPTVSFSGGGGTGARAVATVMYGTVLLVTILDGGTGYTSDPAVTFSAPPSGVTATAAVTFGQYSLWNEVSAGPMRIDSGNPAAPNSTTFLPYFARLTADQATNATTATAVPGLSFTIGANEVWTVEFNCRIGKASGTNGTKYAIAIPAGATVMGQVFGTVGSATAFATEVITASATLTSTAFNTTATSNGVMRITACIVNGATAGTVQLQQASVTSQNAIVLANSYMVARRIA